MLRVRPSNVACTASSFLTMSRCGRPLSSVEVSVSVSCCRSSLAKVKPDSESMVNDTSPVARPWISATDCSSGTSFSSGRFLTLIVADTETLGTSVSQPSTLTRLSKNFPDRWIASVPGSILRSPLPRSTSRTLKATSERMPPGTG